MATLLTKRKKHEVPWSLTATDSRHAVIKQNENAVFDPQTRTAVAGDGYLLLPVQRRLPLSVVLGANCLVRIRNQWWDVGRFMDRHPGGDLIKEFIGADVTVPFRMWHRTKIFENPGWYLQPVAEADIEFGDDRDSGRDNASHSEDPSQARAQCGSDASLSEESASEQQKKKYFLSHRPPDLHAADADYLALYADLERTDCFRLPSSFLVQRFALMAVFLAVPIFVFRHAWIYKAKPSNRNFSAWEPHLASLLHILACFCLYLFWQQCAGIMHDCGHNHYFGGVIKPNARLMFLCGNIGFGVSSSFWKWEHVEHHSFANSFDNHGLNRDPQQNEVWCQCEKMGRAQLAQPKPSWFKFRFVVNIQEWLFYPLIVLLGRFGITVDGFATETRAYEFAGFMIHLLFLWHVVGLRHVWPVQPRPRTT